VFESRVLRRILGLKMEEMAVSLSRLHTEELHNLQISPDIRVINQGG
jgi:hypothetical protein